jgi:hypothetical protein
MKRTMLVLAVAAMSVVFMFAVVNATQETPDTITLESTKAFPEHKKSLVTFSHKKHNVDYGIACADCHHTYTDGKNTWKEGDPVQACEECHTGGKPAASEAKGMSDEDKIKGYLYYAIHENCKGCHTALKKEGKPTGPTSCSQCHPKE